MSTKYRYDSILKMCKSCFILNMSIFEQVGTWCKENIIACIVGAFVFGFFITLYTLREKLDDTTEIVIDSLGENSSAPEQESEDSDVTVDLAGAVNKPGVYALPLGSRVGDLLRVGEGLSQKAAAVWVAQNLNLSLPLEDSQKVYIPFVWDVSYSERYELKPLVLADKMEQSSAPSSSENSSVKDLVMVNTCSQEVLEELPGIGPTYAARIIENRPYTDFQDLVNKSGVTESTLVKIQPFIAFK